ncbi:MAG: RNA methyltransferase [Gomphosphaeria aponina SAG 52.96 = DSM 107014]|uniref:tRNA (cytidine/uridine-2'-O-)-methyltransferase TrmJ n=1 Tax=Gomphosphaeria aponina SAG 52.96 = DSM 107014 TaxID=1521640 RepID=A0A941JKV2_9CHRO|nr:RNA methyltransferase [Gomphosphaeria aponina SAG 52.96 = DSM 107014]
MGKTKLAKVRIVLVEPAGALNVGSVARVMTNMQLEQLVLVKPQCDHLGEEGRRMAVHGVEVLRKAVVVESLAEALVGCGRAIATTARPRSLATQLETPRTALPWLLGENIDSALIFGPEDRGLSNEELNYGQRFVCIPANPVYPSLNLASAVAVCAYELAICEENGEKRENLPLSEPLATLDALEGYYEQLESVLLHIGYLYPHTAGARMEKLRRLFNRVSLSELEVGMLRGILSQVEWAVEFLHSRWE